MQGQEPQKKFAKNPEEEPRQNPSCWSVPRPWLAQHRLEAKQAKKERERLEEANCFGGTTRVVFMGPADWLVIFHCWKLL